ncbi:MAG: hypothetical protein CMF61_01870 [Magnetococcales bacterium]|nr:hypothetical protein [Magnetococcales bacterium]
MFKLALTALISVIPQGVYAGDDSFLKGGMVDSLWVSPNEDMMLFMYTRYNFFNSVILGKDDLKVTGFRPKGHHKNNVNPWSDSDLYFKYKDANGNWSKAINFPLNDGKANCCAMISENEIFYQYESNIYKAEYVKGEWGKGEALNINSEKIDTNPHYDAESKILYWSSNRSGGFDIWQSKRINDSTWGKPEKVKGDVNTSAKEDQPFVWRNELRFSRDNTAGNMLAIYKEGEGWVGSKPENLGVNMYHAEVSLSKDGTTAYYVVGDIEKGKLYFMKSHRFSPQSKWFKPTVMSVFEE